MSHSGHDHGEHDMMTPGASDEGLRHELTEIQRLGGLVGVAALALAILTAFVIKSEREAFLHAYLWAYAFWLGMALGCGTICMIHNLTGGRWGQPGKRIWLAGNGTMVVMVILGLPLLIGSMKGYVWLWSNAEGMKQYGPHKAQFFQMTWVHVRALIYAVVWIGSSVILATAQKRIEATGSFPVRWWYARVSAVCIILYVLSLTFAVIDWVMSLEPTYYSTMYALIFAVGEVLSAFALSVLVISLLMRDKSYEGKVNIEQYADMGTMMFAFVVLWAYTSFFQFLISWMGNLQNEMHWYVVRNTGGWHFLAACLILLQFCLPFVLLLQRPIKRNPCILMSIAAGILFMRLVDLYWLITPAFPAGNRVSIWMDPLVVVGIGGIFVWKFVGKLNAGPLTPPPLLPGEIPPTGHGHAAFSRAAALAKAQGVQQV